MEFLRRPHSRIALDASPRFCHSAPPGTKATDQWSNTP